MNKETFKTPFSRYFPRKVVRYLLASIDDILEYRNSSVDENEQEILMKFKNDLLNKKLYYEKASLNFARTVYPLILKKEISAQTQQLYSEVLRLNPNLVSGFLGYDLIFKKVFHVQ
ncbi:hypothetical protein [Enterococcus sp. HY326]|uniref:hypothetical protein n=1 Tax=Enterococcus sp. HY326 TaxID=2971265 RepID=UPI00223EA1F7|nr:hypothetical protein [Enterococcus sp. HY326]